MRAVTHCRMSARCTSGAPTRPAVAAAGRRLGAWRAAAAPQAVPGAAGSEERLLAEIAEKEALLASMFERRPMPKASEVAALRAEVDRLRAALPQRPGAAPPPPPAMDAAAVARATAVMSAALGAAPGNAEDREVAALEAENTALRAQAHALLAHQALLEAKLAEALAARGAGSGGGGAAGAKQ